MLQTNPVINNKYKASSAASIKDNPILSELSKISNKLRKFQPIIKEITISGNDVLIESDRIILAEK